MDSSAGAAANPPAAVPHPTTESLLHGAQTPVHFHSIPITMSAPAGWAVNIRSGIEYFEGPTPAGVGQIQIAHRTFPTAGFAQTMIAASKKSIEVPTRHPLDHVVTRDIATGVTVIDARRVGRTMNEPSIDESGKQIAATHTPLDWKINVVLPGGGTETEFAEISFVDLSVEQYEVDKEQLEKMVASIAFDPATVNRPAAPSTPSPRESSGH